MADERTLITDIYIPVMYDGYQAVNDPETSAFFLSGVAARSANLDAKAKSGGRIVHMPFWGDIDQSVEPSYSDDSMNFMEPDKIIAGEQQARVSYMNHALRAPDLIDELAGSSPMQQIKNRFGAYWQRVWERRVLACLRGIYADNVANDSGDMVYDVSGTNTDNDDDAKFSTVNVLDAIATSGDRQDDYRAIAMHSHIYTRAKKNNLIDFIPDSQGALTIPTYLGMRVIVDDLMLTTAAAGAGGSDAAKKYFTILFGSSLIGYGEGLPKVPSYVERKETQGNGGGMEVIGERKTMLIHPNGFDFLSSSIGLQSPTLAELAEAAQWNRKIDRKLIKLAYLVTNN